MNTCDYSSSFLQFTTDRPPNTAVGRVGATCELTLNGGTPKQYVLTDECICETMYVSKNLVQRPAAEFRAIASSEEFMFLKDTGGAGRDLRESHRVGEVTSTHDGKGTSVERIDITLAQFPQAQPLESDEQICEAILGNRPITGRSWPSWR